MCCFIRSFMIVFFIFSSKVLYSFDVKAKEAILIDLLTDTVLFEKNADELTVPSSMTKIMTIYMIFEGLQKGTLTLDDEFYVSKNAFKTLGSRTFLNLGSYVSVRNLINGVIIQSGNDASVVLAEGFMGSEKAFANAMTFRANELGAKNTCFKNASGLPDEGHLTTVRDLAIIAKKTLINFPEYYHFYSGKKFTYNDIEQYNRNKLLFRNLGVDGLKTGYTNLGGYGLVASAIKNNRRLLMVVNGFKTDKDRTLDSESLLKWGFYNFSTINLFVKNRIIDSAKVWLGKKNKVDILTLENLYITLPRLEVKDIKMKIVYKSPIPAPIKKGDKIGKVIITAPSIKDIHFPVFAAEDVEKIGFWKRIYSALYYLILGQNPEKNNDK